MTAQIPDFVWLEGRRYRLAGVSGRGLFDPQDVGLRPAATSTANWRGFHCTYGVEDSRLVLQTVYIGLAEPTELFGRQPERGGITEFAPNSWAFKNLGRPIRFSGGLLLGDGPTDRTSRHIGTPPPWTYATLLELELHDGRLTATTDHSESASRFRSTMDPSGLAPNLRRLVNRDAPADAERWPERVRAWMDETFALDYNEMDPLSGH
jgi:hypothetical protein